MQFTAKGTEISSAINEDLLTNLAQEAKTAAQQHRMKDLYDIIRKFERNSIHRLRPSRMQQATS